MLFEWCELSRPHRPSQRKIIEPHKFVGAVTANTYTNLVDS